MMVVIIMLVVMIMVVMVVCAKLTIIVDEFGHVLVVASAGAFLAMVMIMVVAVALLPFLVGVMVVLVIVASAGAFLSMFVFMVVVIVASAGAFLSMFVFMVMVVLEGFLVDVVVETGVVDCVNHPVEEFALFDIENCAHEVEVDNIATCQGTVMLDTVVHIDEVEGYS